VLRQCGLSAPSVESYLSSRRVSAEGSELLDGVPLAKSAVLALHRAHAEAVKRQHTYVGVEHLLLGIAAEDSGEAADFFASLHVDKEHIRQIVENEIG